MKKSMCITLVLAVTSLMTACSLIPSDPNRPGYQEGRTAAFFYVATEDIQPEEMNSAIKTTYHVLKASILEDGMFADEAIVKTEIAEMWPDASPQFHATMFNFYSMAKIRLINEIDVNPDIPSPDVVKNFIQGVQDSLKDYKYGWDTDETTDA